MQLDKYWQFLESAVDPLVFLAHWVRSRTTARGSILSPSHIFTPIENLNQIVLFVAGTAQSRNLGCVLQPGDRYEKRMMSMRMEPALLWGLTC
jgi:hypothetical protein